MCYPRDNIFVAGDSGDVIEITPDGAKKNGRIPVGGIMYDDMVQFSERSGAFPYANNTAAKVCL